MRVFSCVSLLPLSLIFIVPSGAKAQPLEGPPQAEELSHSPWFDVTRALGAERCPDAAELESATRRLLGDPPDDLERRFRVTFTWEANEGRAHLHHVDGDGEGRELVDRQEDCEALKQAVVTALVLWIEADREERALAEESLAAAEEASKESDEFVDALSDEPSPLEERPHERDEPVAAERPAISGAVSAGSAFALATNAAPFVSVRLGFRSGRLGVSGGGLWVLPTEVGRGPGHVESEIIAGTLRLCGELFRLGQVDLWGCAGLFGGAVSARAIGYTRDDAARRPFWALPFELSVGWPARLQGAWGASLRGGVTVLIPTERQNFSVEGWGTVLEPAPVGALLWLEVGALFRL